MAKLSWMKWYPDDWMRSVRSLSIEAKGCWIEILMLMWNAPKRGVWEGTYQEFARVTGCPWEIAPRLVRELTKVADLTESNNILTLENRRMIREQTMHENNRIRQRKHYANTKPNANLTDKTPLDSSRLHKTPQDNTLTKRVFVRPSAEEVTAYGASIGFQIDGAAFCDFYESKGWKVGNTPMRSWQAAVRTWKRRPRDGFATASPVPQLPPPPTYADIPESERMTDEEMRAIKDKAMGGINARNKVISQNV